MKTTWHVPCLAIVAILIIEVVALATGHNGWLMTMSVAAISGIGGYSIKDVLLKR